VIDDLDSVLSIELEHDSIPVIIQIDIIRNQPVQARQVYWLKTIVYDEWITTSVTTWEEIQSRTTWNDGRHFMIGYQEKWDHPITALENKLIAYQRQGYKITKIRRQDE
jgi:hypothetical protein